MQDKPGPASILWHLNRTLSTCQERVHFVHTNGPVDKTLASDALQVVLDMIDYLETTIMVRPYLQF